MTEYFRHDYNARNEIKLKKVFMKHGMTGIGLYWCLIEMLYENNGYINNEQISVLAFDWRVDESLIIDIVENYGLFETDDNGFFSNGVLKRLNERQSKSNKAKASANVRWDRQNNANAMRTQCNRNATAMQSQCDRNAIIGENRIVENSIIKKEKENYVKEKDKSLSEDVSLSRNENQVQSTFLAKNDNLVDEEQQQKERRFVKPTIEEITNYCSEQHYELDAQHFIDYYESKGWYVGKNKMKDWKAAVRTWQRKRNDKSVVQQKPYVDGSGYKIL